MPDDRVQYWLETAEYDLGTAQSMLETGRFLYVGFMCHQVIEKALKALIADQGKIPPYIHNLSKLAQLAGVYERMSAQQIDMLDSLEPLNIQARYPENRAGLTRLLTSDKCATLTEGTEELYQWIKAML